MRVIVESNMCMGSGNCVGECPEVFAQDENGVVVLREESPPQELHEAVEQAAAECPSQCISVEA